MISVGQDGAWLPWKMRKPKTMRRPPGGRAPSSSTLKHLDVEQSLKEGKRACPADGDDDDGLIVASVAVVFAIPSEIQIVMIQTSSLEFQLLDNNSSKWYLDIQL